MLTEQEAQQIVTRIVSFSKADNVEVNFGGGTTSHLRFANNSPSTSGSAANVTISLRSTFGKKTGTVGLNQTDDGSLREGVRRSEELARLSPEDPEFMPPLGPQRYEEINSFDKTMADNGPEFMADAAAECIQQAAKRNLLATGFLQSNAGWSALGNSRGLFGYHRTTSLYFSETVRTPEGDGSGWVSAASHRTADLRFQELARIAVDKAALSRNPKPLSPGKYVTILEPSCVADMLQGMIFSLNARTADEGRSFFSRREGGNKLGEKLFPENVTIYTDPSDPLAPGSRWGADGLPQRRIEWVKDGVLTNLNYSRYWAEKQKTTPTPGASNLIFNGGDGSLEDLIRSTKQGVLVTSIWYIRSVDPRSLLLTGLTRDGVFWIENGKISHPVNNFRWNDSPISVLRNIDAMSKQVRVPPRESRSPNVVVPALRVKEFNFSSVSEAV